MFLMTLITKDGALVGDSAKKALRNLQFYRFAYAFGGGGLVGPAPHLLAAEFFAQTAVECDYRAEARALSLDQQKLACAMLALAGEGLPRGGSLVLSADPAGPQIEASGAGPGPSPEIRAALALAVPAAELTSRTVGGYFAGLLAETQGRRLSVADRPGGFRLRFGGRLGPQSRRKSGWRGGTGAGLGRRGAPQEGPLA